MPDRTLQKKEQYKLKEFEDAAASFNPRLKAAQNNVAAIERKLA